jgi:hypothetical protein
MDHDGYPLVFLSTIRSRPMRRHTADLGYPANCFVLFLSTVSVSVFRLFVYSPPPPPSPFCIAETVFLSVAGVCPRRSDYGLSVLACLIHLYPSTSHMTYVFIIVSMYVFTLKVFESLFMYWSAQCQCCFFVFAYILGPKPL